jgi:hypothetical protein
VEEAEVVTVGGVDGGMGTHHVGGAEAEAMGNSSGAAWPGPDPLGNGKEWSGLAAAVMFGEPAAGEGSPLVAG